jgi:hypothetical protein
VTDPLSTNAVACTLVRTMINQGQTIGNPITSLKLGLDVGANLENELIAGEANCDPTALYSP